MAIYIKTTLLRAAKVKPKTFEQGGLSCHNCCDRRPRSLLSHPKDCKQELVGQMFTALVNTAIVHL